MTGTASELGLSEKNVVVHTVLNVYGPKRTTYDPV